MKTDAPFCRALARRSPDAAGSKKRTEVDTDSDMTPTRAAHNPPSLVR